MATTEHPQNRDTPETNDQREEDGVDTTLLARGFKFRDTDQHPDANRGAFFQLLRDGNRMDDSTWDGYWLLRRFRVMKRERRDEETDEDGFRDHETLVRKASSRLSKEYLIERLEEGRYQPGWGGRTDVIEDHAAPLTERDSQ